MLSAIMDVGSNTIRLSLYEVDEVTHTFKQVLNKKAMVGLAGYIEKGRLSERGILRAADTIATHLRRLEDYNVDNVSAFATAVIRNADNRSDVLERLERETGVSIELLSGTEEALLGNFGALHCLDGPDGVSLDMGGASSELVVFEKRQARFARSLRFGSLTLFLGKVAGLFPTADEQRAICGYVQEQLTAQPELAGMCADTLVGIGGAARAVGKLADHIFNADEKTRHVEVAQMEEMLEILAHAGKPELLTVLQAVPDRIHTVVPGMLCVYTVAKFLHADALCVSRYGIREGYLCSRVIGETFERWDDDTVHPES